MSSYKYGTKKVDYSGTGGAYAGTHTTNGYGGEWFQIDIGRQVTVRLIKYKLTLGSYNAIEIKVFGSNDSSSWTEILELDYPGPDQTRFSIPTPTAGSYRYYRFVGGKIYQAASNVHVFFLMIFSY